MNDTTRKLLQYLINLSDSQQRDVLYYVMGYYSAQTCVGKSDKHKA